MNKKVEARAKQLFSTGKYSMKEAFGQAERESKLDLPEGFDELFPMLKGEKR
jgi:hypothetical protein